MSTDTELGGWPVSVRGVPVAWGDMDAFGHVNNTVYLRWFETARIAYFEAIGLTDRMKVSGTGPILARATCDFRLPLAYPDAVDALATVTKLGNTSFIMGYQVRSRRHDGALAAAGEGVIVMYDYAANGSVPLSPELSARIRALEASAPRAPVEG